MKKIILPLSVLLVTLSWVSASASSSTILTIDKGERREWRRERHEQRKEERLHSPSWSVGNRFLADFPEAQEVAWTRGEYREAHFLNNGIQTTAYYDEDNDLVGTTRAVAMAALPEKALAHIAKSWGDYTIEQAILFDDNEANDSDMFLFSTAFAGKDDYFALLKKDNHEIVLQIDPDGSVGYFTTLR